MRNAYNVRVHNDNEKNFILAVFVNRNILKKTESLKRRWFEELKKK